MGYLDIHNVTMAYGDKEVVKNAKFAVDQGEIVVLLGASGDGKTTLMKGVAGFLPLKKGEVRLDGVQLQDVSEKLIPGHEKIRLVNQDFGLDEHHTVEENLRLKLLSFNKEYQLARIKTLLQLTGLLKYKSQKALLLSGGQRQRLAIARALADEPEVLLLDEPFNQLDFQTKTKISKHIKAYFKKNDIAALMVTHNGIEAMEWADKVVYFENGKVKRIDSPQSFYNSPQSAKEARFFGQLNKLEINNQTHFFRPSFYRFNKSKEFPIKIDIKFIRSEFFGWYSSYTFEYANQRIELYATEDLKELTEVYIKTFKISA